MRVFAERIKALRAERGWTLKQVAEMMGLPTPQRVHNYEADKSEPDFEIASGFAALYGTSVDYLIGKTNDRTPNRPLIIPPEIERVFIDDGEVIDIVRALVKMTPEQRKVFGDFVAFQASKMAQEPAEKIRKANEPRGQKE
jgi:transcriptional regulator with XRE-family HTH domain